jgi:hypothetical protein
MIILVFSVSLTAFASSTLLGAVEGQIPVVAGQGSVTLASIRYAEAGGTRFQTGDTISITLPAGMEFRTGLTSSSYYETTSNLAVSYVFSDNRQTVTYTLIRGSQLTEEIFLAKLPVVIVGSLPSTGSVLVSIVSNNASITGGTFIAGSYGTLSANISITPGTVPVLSQYENNPQIIPRTISLTENGPGALKNGIENKVMLYLTQDQYWANASYYVQAYPALPVGVSVTAVREGPNELGIFLTGGTTSAATAFSLINPAINVSSVRDIMLQVAGKGQNTGVQGKFTLAKVSDEIATVSRQLNVNPFDVMAGRQNQAMANIEIIEATAASLAVGGEITLTLPRGLQFFSPPSATYSGISGTQPQIVSNSGNRTIAIKIIQSSDTAGNVVVNLNSSGNILVSPGYSGAVSIDVSGTAGASGSVVVANVMKPVTVSATEVVDIPKEAVNLTGGELVIMETAAGNISTGVIVLQLPDGITFTSSPSIHRSEGNINFGSGNLSNDGSTYTIPINSRSTQASKVSISNINYEITGRWWNLGIYKVEVILEGNSLTDTAVSTAFTTDKLKAINAEFGIIKSSVFTIGEKAYTFGRERIEMDQEPVIVSGRTMLPLRFAGEAVGLEEDDIYWDPVERTVTLFRGNRVAQVKIGSKTLLINGAPVEMDVAPEIMNSRTMLPIRWIGLALNVDVEWDASARTVTVTP